MTLQREEEPGGRGRGASQSPNAGEQGLPRRAQGPAAIRILAQGTGEGSSGTT